MLNAKKRLLLASAGNPDTGISSLFEGLDKEVLSNLLGKKALDKEFNVDKLSTEEIQKITEYMTKNKYNKGDILNTLIFMSGTYEFENVGLSIFTEKGMAWLKDQILLKMNLKLSGKD